MSAVEAYHEFGLVKETTVGLFVASQWSPPSPLRLETAAQIELPYASPTSRSLNHSRALRRAVNEAGRFLSGYQVRRLFVGHDGLVMRAIAEICRPQEVILLDDGSAVIGAGARRARSFDNCGGKVRSLFEGLIRRAMYGRNPDPIPQLTFFSMFEPELGPNDTLKPNAGIHLKSIARMTRRFPGCFFVGSPVVQLGYVSSQRWQNILALYDAELQLPVRYFLHHSEDPDFVERYVPQRWELVRDGRPLEIILLLEERPDVIASSMSTVLYSASRLLPSDVRLDSLRLPTESQSPETAEKLTVIYDHYEATGRISILRFDGIDGSASQ